MEEIKEFFKWAYKNHFAAIIILLVSNIALSYLRASYLYYFSGLITSVFAFVCFFLSFGFSALFVLYLLYLIPWTRKHWVNKKNREKNQ